MFWNQLENSINEFSLRISDVRYTLWYRWRNLSPLGFTFHRFVFVTFLLEFFLNFCETSSVFFFKFIWYVCLPFLKHPLNYQLSEEGETIPKRWVVRYTPLVTNSWLHLVSVSWTITQNEIDDRVFRRPVFVIFKLYFVWKPIRSWNFFT